MSDKGIGESILDAMKEGVHETLSESTQEVIEVDGKKVQMEQFGDPTVKGDTIRIPVVVAAVFDDYDAEIMEPIDQAWIDKSRDMLLQRLVLRLNPSDPYHGRRRMGNIFFDTENFKVEYLAGNIVRLTGTIICDMSDLLGSIRELRYDLGYTLREMARRPGKGISGAVKVAR